MILHEAPHRLAETLAELAAALGGTRAVALCRELTKRNEEILRTTLDGAIAHYSQTEPRGEYVLIVAGEESSKPETPSPLLALSPADHVAYYEKQGMGRMDAIKQVAKDKNMPKNELYRLLHQEK